MLEGIAEIDEKEEEVAAAEEEEDGEEEVEEAETEAIVKDGKQYGWKELRAVPKEE